MIVSAEDQRRESALVLAEQLLAHLYRYVPAEMVRAEHWLQHESGESVGVVDVGTIRAEIGAWDGVPKVRVFSSDEAETSSAVESYVHVDIATRRVAYLATHGVTPNLPIEARLSEIDVATETKSSSPTGATKDFEGPIVPLRCEYSTIDDLRSCLLERKYGMTIHATGAASPVVLLSCNPGERQVAFRPDALEQIGAGGLARGLSVEFTELRDILHRSGYGIAIYGQSEGRLQTVWVEDLVRQKNADDNLATLLPVAAKLAASRGELIAIVGRAYLVDDLTVYGDHADVIVIDHSSEPLPEKQPQYGTVCQLTFAQFEDERVRRGHFLDAVIVGPSNDSVEVEQIIATLRIRGMLIRLEPELPSPVHHETFRLRLDLASRMSASIREVSGGAEAIDHAIEVHRDERPVTAMLIVAQSFERWKTFESSKREERALAAIQRCIDKKTDVPYDIAFETALGASFVGLPADFVAWLNDNAPDKSYRRTLSRITSLRGAV